MTDDGFNVSGALRQAKALGVDRLDAQLLLSHILMCPRSWLLAHADATLNGAQESAMRSALTRRVAGEPVAYLIGEKDFHGLTFRVDASVLVPRPDTELLVDWALELLNGPLRHIGRPRVVDLGTGSGAIALAVKHEFPAADVLASDISVAALRVAQDNARRLRLEVTCTISDWWAAFAGRHFHLTLGNPPYIADGDPHLAALQHEPRLALTPGGDGLTALRLIIDGAPHHLAPGGWMLLEHGYDQAPAVQGLLRSNGFVDIESRLDSGGHLRCTAAHR